LRQDIETDRSSFLRDAACIFRGEYFDAIGTRTHAAARRGRFLAGEVGGNPIVVRQVANRSYEG
jgi:hypothetical protein